MDKNTFSADVRRGGLQDFDQIKMLICLIIDRAEFPLSKESITNIITNEQLANYFDITNAFSKLVDEKNIVDNGNQTFSITKNGKIVANELEKSIPRSVRDRAMDSLEHEILLLKRLENNDISIEPEAGGYRVIIRIIENGIDLIAVSVHTKNYSQANKVKQTFLNDPTRIYLTNYKVLFGIYENDEE